LGELDNFFKNDEWCQVLMDGEEDPLVIIVDKIFNALYSK